MITYEPLDFSDISFRQYSDLLCSVFIKNRPKTIEYLKWEYLENPLGKALGYDAYYENKLIGHYVAQPIKSMINGEIQSGLFALHVAVDPQFRGKGIFAEINNKTHELAKGKGFQFVIGVANQKSTYVYTKKLGFSLVTPLSTKIGFGFPSIDLDNKTDNKYSRLWTDELLNWRLQNPNNTYYFTRTNNGKFILGKSSTPGIYSIITFIPENRDFLLPTNIKQIKNQIPIVWYGLNSIFSWRFYKHIGIPKILKPSPLNLIYLSLTDKNIDLTNKKIVFNPIDHDAY